MGKHKPTGRHIIAGRTFRVAPLRCGLCPAWDRQPGIVTKGHCVFIDEVRRYDCTPDEKCLEAFRMSGLEKSRTRYEYFMSR